MLFQYVPINVVLSRMSRNDVRRILSKAKIIYLMGSNPEMFSKFVYVVVEKTVEGANSQTIKREENTKIILKLIEHYVQDYDRLSHRLCTQCNKVH